MKAKLVVYSTALILGAISLIGCASLQNAGNSLSAWWHKPETQEKAESLKEAIFSVAMAAGTEAVRELATGGNIDKGRLGMVAGAATLYTAANYLRTLQSTDNVISNDAISQKLIAAGVPPQNVTTLSEIISGNASSLVSQGVSGNAANELSASAFDAAALEIQNNNAK